MEDFPWDFPAPHGADEDPKLAVEPKKKHTRLEVEHGL